MPAPNAVHVFCHIQYLPHTVLEQKTHTQHALLNPKTIGIFNFFLWIIIQQVSHCQSKILIYVMF